MFIFMASAMFSSCSKEELNDEILTENNVNRSDVLYNFELGSDTIAEVMPPILTSNLPIFPFEVLYVVCKEYESVEDGTSSKSTYKNRHILSYSKNEYAESRLIDLYPDKAYPGIVEDSENFYDSVVNVYNSYPYFESSSNVRSEYVIDEKPEEELKYISDENEMEILNMTEQEIIRFKAMIDIARMENFATLNDIFKASGNSMMLTEKVDWLFWGMIAAIVDLGAYVYNRALLCAERANSKSLAYYGEYNSNQGMNIVRSGTKGDAFRHIFVNVMLRYDLSRTLAYLIMDVYYENANQNYPCDQYMDWHNNYVGRVTKYSAFKTGTNWETWGVNVKNYVNNSSNGVFKNWTTSTSKRIVKKEEKEVNDNKYIFISY